MTTAVDREVASRFGVLRLRDFGNPRASERAAQKVRRQEQGHEYVEAKLIRLGAPVPRAGGDA